MIAHPPSPLPLPAARPARARPGHRHRRRALPAVPIAAAGGLWARLADDQQAVGLKLVLILVCLLLAAGLEARL